jgi:hypothetical protein
VNIDELHHPEKYVLAKEERAQIIPHGEGSGQLKIYYVQKHAKYELPAEEHGVFFSANAYLVAYTVTLHDGSKRHVVYFWQVCLPSLFSLSLSLSPALLLFLFYQTGCVSFREEKLLKMTRELLGFWQRNLLVLLARE